MINKEKFNDDKNEWISISTNSTQEIEKILEDKDISKKDIYHIITEHKRAHVDYNNISDTLIFNFNVPNSKQGDDDTESSSIMVAITFIVKDNHFITITDSRSEYINKLVKKTLEEDSKISSYILLFKSILKIIDFSFISIEKMDEQRKVIDKAIRKNVSKKNLTELTGLQMNMSYFISASKQNKIILQELENKPLYTNMTKEEVEELNADISEEEQLVEMGQAAADVLQQLSDNYNNIMNNNINDYMNALTVLSVLLTLPSIISGYMGMNVMRLPLAHNPHGWSIILFITVMAWIVASLMLRLWIRRK